jgi:hypothetical protein
MQIYMYRIAALPDPSLPSAAATGSSTNHVCQDSCHPTPRDDSLPPADIQPASFLRLPLPAVPCAGPGADMADFLKCPTVRHMLKEAPHKAANRVVPDLR